MEYKVMFKDEEGRNIVTPVMSEEDKNSYVKSLNGIDHIVINCNDKRWQLAGVVFDIQLIPAARKAVKERKQIKGMYTFGDPKKVSEKNSIVEVECTNAELRIGYVVAVFRATTEEVKAFKEKIGYSHLGLVKRKL